MLSIISINENNYYNMKDMVVQNRDFFHGCISKPRTIIIKKKIPETEYIYANFIEKSNKWNVTTVESKKANLLISKEWVDTSSFFNNKPTELKVNTDENMTELVEKSPPLLELEENEKFKDAEGKVLEIETRGEKTQNGIFFKVVDVSKAFDMPYLKDTLLDGKSGAYKRDEDFFVFDIRTSSEGNSLRTSTKKYLYLSYEGMLRVLYVSFCFSFSSISRFCSKRLSNFSFKLL